MATKESIMDVFLPVSAVVGFITIWSLSVHLFRIPSYFLPAPEVVTAELLHRGHLF